MVLSLYLGVDRDRCGIGKSTFGCSCDADGAV